MIVLVEECCTISNPSRPNSLHGFSVTSFACAYFNRNW